MATAEKVAQVAQTKEGEFSLLDQAIASTKIAKLLNGFRGTPEVDMGAIARAARRIGQLMLTRPEHLAPDWAAPVDSSERQDAPVWRC